MRQRTKFTLDPLAFVLAILACILFAAWLVQWYHISWEQARKFEALAIIAAQLPVGVPVYMFVRIIRWHKLQRLQSEASWIVSEQIISEQRDAKH